MLLMGQSTISMAMFNSFLYVYQRVNLHFPMGFPMVFHPMMFPNVHRSPDEFFATGTGPQPQQKLDTEDQRSQRLAALPPSAHRPASCCHEKRSIAGNMMVI